MRWRRTRRALWFTGVVLGAIAWLAWVYFWSGLPSIDARHLDAAAFDRLFGERIYRFRVLSRWLLELLDQGVSISARSFVPPTPRWSPFLAALFVLNAAGLGASCWYVFHFCHRSRFVRHGLKRPALAFVATSLVLAGSGVTVTAYDFTAYALLLVTAWCTFKFAECSRPAWLLAVTLLTFVATLNRETAWLHVALWCAVVVHRRGSEAVWRTCAFVAGVGFVVPYFGLRVLLGFSEATHNRSELVHNFATIEGVFGLVAWGVVHVGSFVVAGRVGGRRAWLIFQACAAPYSLMCIYAGRLEEVRLLVPLVLSQGLLLSRLGASRPLGEGLSLWGGRRKQC